MLYWLGRVPPTWSVTRHRSALSSDAAGKLFGPRSQTSTTGPRASKQRCWDQASVVHDLAYSVAGRVRQIHYLGCHQSLTIWKSDTYRRRFCVDGAAAEETSLRSEDSSAAARSTQKNRRVRQIYDFVAITVETMGPMTMTGLIFWR